jgi:hypothetical protein
MSSENATAPRLGGPPAASLAMPVDATPPLHGVDCPLPAVTPRSDQLPYFNVATESRARR